MRFWFIEKIWKFLSSPPGQDIRDVMAQLPKNMQLFNASSVISSADREILFDALLTRMGGSVMNIPQGPKSVVFVSGAEEFSPEIKRAFEAVYAKMSDRKIEW